MTDNYNKIISLILLTVPEGEKTGCKFDKLQLRYSLPDDSHNRLKEIDYWRLLRFIRLWKKLGWSIEETDKAITALYKAEFRPDAADSINTQKQKLDDGFKDLFVKIEHVKRIEENLNLNEAWKRVKKNKGAAGIDKVTIDEFERNLEQNLNETQRLLDKNFSQG